MKIFLDMVNIEEISKYSYIIDGVTINPTRSAQEKTGSHVIIIPPKVFFLMFKHYLTDTGIKRFLDDWAQITNKSGNGLK